MAQDMIGLMDALGINSAHLVGASMGGMIAQEIAISFPQRVRSLTSIMSTTGNPKLPPPTREATAVLMAPPPTTREEYFVRFAQTWKVLRVGSFPQDEALDRSRAERTFERGLNPAGVGTAAPRHPRLRQPQGAAGIGQGADAGHSWHRRSAGAPEGRQGHRRLDPRRQTSDDRGHGPRAADPDVAARSSMLSTSMPTRLPLFKTRPHRVWVPACAGTTCGGGCPILRPRRRARSGSWCRDRRSSAAPHPHPPPCVRDRSQQVLP